MVHTHDITTIGKRLVPQIVDARAQSGYARPFALVSRSPNPSDGFEEITYKRFANAVNRASWWIDSELSGLETDQCFSYFGPNDLRYTILLYAAQKTGKRVLYCSLRNSMAAQLSLFERANCKIMVYCSTMASNLQPLLNACENIPKYEFINFTDLLAEESVDHYAYDTPFEHVPNVPLWTLHSSGTSGDPKPINWNKSFISSLDYGHCPPPGQGATLLQTLTHHQNLLIVLPQFHAAGLFFTLSAAFFEMTIVLGHPDVWFSPDYISGLLLSHQVTSFISPPSVLEGLSKVPQGVVGLSAMEHVCYAGGPLRPDVGHALAPKLKHLCSLLGATEWGLGHLVCGPSKHWSAMRFFEGVGYRFDETAADLFELVMVNDLKTNIYHGTFEAFPQLKEYRTKDLWSPVPDLPPGWLKYQGRIDDLIALSNGEKVNPIPMENIICSHPDVKAALVIGEYRFSPSILVQMEDDHMPQNGMQIQATLDQIWPIIQEANRMAPGFAKIPKSLVLFTTPNKPFMLAGKGTIQRQNTVKLYAAELNELYHAAEMGLLVEGLTIEKPITMESMSTFIRQIYQQVLEVEDLLDEQDVFEKGMDSLRVSVTVSRLRAALRSSDVAFNLSNISPRLVYSAPTVTALAKALTLLLGQHNGFKNSNGVASSRVKLETMLNRYSQDFPELLMRDNTPVKKPWTVILTGSTGSLGSYVLNAIHNLPPSDIVRIYCLNRGPDSIEKQKKISKRRGLATSWDTGRVEFLQADLSKPDLGLGTSKHAELLEHTTVIIHNAWRVDFNLSLDSFETQILGVRNLLDFSARSRNNTPLLFTSSISTVFGWLSANPTQKMREAVPDDFESPEAIGYAQSKYISERLLESFSKASGITTAVLRTGQIAGPITSGTGQWNKQEWFPSLIISSKYLDALPETLGSMAVVDFIPVDLLATIILELTSGVLSSKKGANTVYNITNPNFATWSSLLPFVQKRLGVKKTVSLQTWVQMLEESSIETYSEQNPAVKLLEYFMAQAQKQTADEQGQRFMVDGLLKDSATARELGAVSEEWMALWFEQWGL